MTVIELIEKLQSYPSDMKVLTFGYQGGLDDVDVKWDSVVFNVNSKDAWHIGIHDYANVASDNEGTECVIIGRHERWHSKVNK